VSGHFRPRSEVSIGHFGPRSEMFRHFGPNFLGPKCPRSEVSRYPGISVRVRIRVRDGVRISNRVRRRVKLVNYSLITALPIATYADPHIRLSAFYTWPLASPQVRWSADYPIDKCLLGDHSHCFQKVL